MNSLPLPESWVEVDIGEINHHKSKSINPAQYPDETFELYSVPTFPTGKPEYLTGAEIGSSKQEVEPGDVLLCKINPRINRVWFVSRKGKYRQIASSEWIVVRQPLISSSFLRAYFSEYNFRQLLCSEVTGVGGSLTRAQPKKVAVYPVRFPSENEQTRIANKLDELLAQVDTIKARVDAIPAILKRFRQSVLAAAVSGKLTEDWRKNNPQTAVNVDHLGALWERQYKENGKKYSRGEIQRIQSEPDEVPETWANTQIGYVFDVFVGATPSRKKSEYWGGEIPWVSSAEVAFCRVQQTKESITESGLKNTSTTVHPKGTVMLAMIGQGKTRGQPAILDIEACHNQNTAALRVLPEHCVSEFLYYYLWMQYEETRKVGAGNNQKALNKSAVQALPFPLPPFEEQKQIVNVINKLFDFADQIERRVGDAKKNISFLTQSVLAKAFRGELVPQDPEDEPAKELLDRIQQAREEADQLAITAKKVVRKTRQKRSASK